MKIGDFFVALGFKIEGHGALNDVQKSMETLRTKADMLRHEIDVLSKAAIEAEAAVMLWEAGTKESNSAGEKAAQITEQLASKKMHLANVEKQLAGETDKLHGKFNTMAIKTAKVAIAVNAVNAAIIALLKTGAQAGLVLDKFNLQTGLSAEELQRWEYASAKAGASADAMAETIRGLQDQQSQIAMGGGDISAFQFFGIDPRQNPFEVLKQLQDRLKEFNDDNIGYARERAHAMGVNDDFFQAIRRQTFDLKALSKELTLTSQEQKNLSEESRQWSAVMLSVIKLKDKFAAAFAPAITEVGRALENGVQWLGKFADWLSKGGFVAMVVKWAFMSLFTGLLLLGTALAALTVVLGAATAAIAVMAVTTSGLLIELLPAVGVIALIAAALGALVLVIDDLVAEAEDGDSVIGEFFKKFRFPVDIIAGNMEILIGLWDLLTGKPKLAAEHFLEAMKDLKNAAPQWLLKLILGIGVAFDMLAIRASMAWDNITGIFERAITRIKAIMPDWMKGIIKTAFTVDGNLGKPGPNSVAASSVPSMSISDMASRAAAPSISSVVGHNTKQENNITVSVDGSDSPKETAREVGKTLRDEIGIASYQMPVPSY